MTRLLALLASLLIAASPLPAPRAAHQLPASLRVAQTTGAPAPVSGARTGVPDGPDRPLRATAGAPSPAAVSPVAHPSPTVGTRAASREAVPDRKPSGTSMLSGVASWFAAPDGTAAAGPALRRALGHDWRGQPVRVCGRVGCATVRLTDWMRRDRAVDLNPGAFRRVCGALSLGVCPVTITLSPPLPETDTEVVR